MQACLSDLCIRQREWGLLGSPLIKALLGSLGTTATPDSCSHILQTPDSVFLSLFSLTRDLRPESGGLDASKLRDKPLLPPPSVCASPTHSCSNLPVSSQKCQVNCISCLFTVQGSEEGGRRWGALEEGGVMEVGVLSSRVEETLW